MSQTASVAAADINSMMISNNCWLQLKCLFTPTSNVCSMFARWLKLWRIHEARHVIEREQTLGHGIQCSRMAEEEDLLLYKWALPGVLCRSLRMSCISILGSNCLYAYMADIQVITVLPLQTIANIQSTYVISISLALSLS